MHRAAETARPGSRIPPAVDPACLQIRRAHFPDQITFHAPGLKRYSTGEWTNPDAGAFVSVSITGNACALKCDHCRMSVLEGMASLPVSGGSLFQLCAGLRERGARGVLISGGSDRQGRVPLLEHFEDLKRIRTELGMTLRVHPGLPDEATCAALGALDIDGAMVDIIGHESTIRDVYHLEASTQDYEHMLARLEDHGVPSVPHIILGLHFGRMLGEWHALEMVARHPPKLLVLVVLMPLSSTPMATVQPPSLEEIAGFFEASRRALPAVPVMLGCARPMGPIKLQIDRLAVETGLNGIAYPAEGIVEYARTMGLEPRFVNACCGVDW
jgi:uncharacterized radical SAM superfamily protein